MTSAITQHNDVSTSAHGSIEARYMALRNQFAHITSVAARAYPPQEALSRYVPTLYRKFGCIARLDLCGKLCCIARLLSTESHNRLRARYNTWEETVERPQWLHYGLHALKVEGLAERAIPPLGYHDPPCRHSVVHIDWQAGLHTV